MRHTSQFGGPVIDGNPDTGFQPMGDDDPFGSLENRIWARFPGIWAIV
jgi:hypothetical protein